MIFFFVIHGFTSVCYLHTYTDTYEHTEIQMKRHEEGKIEIKKEYNNTDDT